MRWRQEIAFALRLRTCALIILLGCVPVLRAAQQDQKDLSDAQWAEGIGRAPTVPYAVPKGLIGLDVAVADGAGKAATGLKAADFRLLDNGQPLEIQAVDSYPNPATQADDPPTVYLVLDGLNLNDSRLATAAREAEKFLQQNKGRLAHPIALYRLASDGLTASSVSTSDGNELARQVASGVEPRPVLKLPNPRTDMMNDCAVLALRNASSLQALGAMVLELRRQPGRKIVVWIGSGWPVAQPGMCRGGGTHYERFWGLSTELSTRMREARIALSSVSMWREMSSEGVADPVRSARDESPGAFSLETLAEQSGGRVMRASNDLAGLIAACAEEASSYYRLWFDPPRTGVEDEYHSLQVDVPKLTARTWTGYYDEPSFYDQPDPVTERVSEAELEEKLTQIQHERSSAIAHDLAGVALTERMSRDRAIYWDAHLHGEQARQALAMVVDAAVFLKPAAAKLPNAAPPDPATQRQMVARTVDYLNRIIPRLPDFYATRTTVGFRDPPLKDSESWKTVSREAGLQWASTTTGIVIYQDGRDHLDQSTVKVTGPKPMENVLATYGTFGPILHVVMQDAAHGTLEWSRWEDDAGARRAVFRFAVPRDKAHYTFKFCCLTDMNGGAALGDPTEYHGEFTIDPKTGDILRMVLLADLIPRMPIIRAGILVEYGPVKIGDNTYICPLHSVSIGRKRTVKGIHEWGGELEAFGPFVTLLSDITFSNYHMTRAQMKILPGFSTVPGQP